MFGLDELLEYIRETGAEASVIPVKVETPTVDAAAQAVGTSPEHIVKSLIFIAAGEPILVIACGNKRVPVNVLAGEMELATNDIRLAKPDEVVAETGYSVGAVPPFGHRKRLPAYMDVALLEAEEVYAGGGASDHLVKVSPEEILRLSGANVIQLQE
jgi:prolyl-tRNA editing enzyme YbaK/EbsC (Cys-tRNA(Pro) deacylase)